MCDASAPFQIVLGVALEEMAQERVVVRAGDVAADAVPLDDAAANVSSSFLGAVAGRADDDASQARRDVPC